MDDAADPAARIPQPPSALSLRTPTSPGGGLCFPCLPESSSHDLHPDQYPPAIRARAFDEWEPSGDPQTDLSQEFIHSGWHRERTRIYHALKRTGKGTNRLRSFCTCGQGAMVYRATKGPEDFKVASLRCHDRFCKPCSRVRAAKVRAKTLAAIKGHKIRMLTLTLRARGEPLKAAIARMLDSFRQLRRLALWRDAVAGCVYVLEITRNNRDRWHVHIHALCTGTYIEVGWLSQAWHAITQDSSVVHVTLARSSMGVARYVAKYATKGIDTNEIADDDDLDEVMTALQGVRLVEATGCFRRRVDDDDAADYLRRDEWELVGSLSDVYALACGGDAAAVAIMTALGTRDPVTNERPQWRAPP